MLKFLYQTKHSPETDGITRKVEDALKSSIQQIQSVDPKTDMQWQRLKNTLAAESIIADDRSFASRWFLSKPAIAVAVVALVAFSIIWMKDSSPKIYETTKAQHSTIILQDSTEVILNSLTELFVSRKLFDDARRVALNGEALFKVRKNEKPVVFR